MARRGRPRRLEVVDRYPEVGELEKHGRVRP
jgi:hypothetical protein